MIKFERFLFRNLFNLGYLNWNNDGDSEIFEQKTVNLNRSILPKFGTTSPFHKFIKIIGTFFVVASGPYHAEIKYGCKEASLVDYADIFSYNYAIPVFKIPMFSYMAGQVGIPFTFMLWIYFRKSLSLLRTHLYKMHHENIFSKRDDSNNVIHEHERHLREMQKARTALSLYISRANLLLVWTVLSKPVTIQWKVSHLWWTDSSTCNRPSHRFVILKSLSVEEVSKLWTELNSLLQEWKVTQFRLTANSGQRKRLYIDKETTKLDKRKKNGITEESHHSKV